MKFLIFLCALFALNSCGIVVKDVVFIKIGDYHGVDDDGNVRHKTYFIPRYSKVSWNNVRPFCKAYDMDIVSLDTLEEAQAVIGMGIAHFNFLETWTFVGGIALTPQSKTDWYWVNSGKKVSYDLPFGPGQPDYHQNNELCLSLGPSSTIFLFNDFPCNSAQTKFICERVE